MPLQLPHQQRTNLRAPSFLSGNVQFSFAVVAVHFFCAQAGTQGMTTDKHGFLKRSPRQAPAPTGYPKAFGGWEPGRRTKGAYTPQSDSGADKRSGGPAEAGTPN